MRTGTFARAIAVSGAALLALTACGGSDDNSGSSGSSSGSEQREAGQHLRHRRQHGQRAR